MNTTIQMNNFVNRFDPAMYNGMNPVKCVGNFPVETLSTRFHALRMDYTQVQGQGSMFYH